MENKNAVENEKTSNVAPEDRIFIFSARPYEMQDRQTGDIRTGSSIEYLDSLAPTPDGIGFKSVKCTIPREIHNSFNGQMVSGTPVYTRKAVTRKDARGNEKRSLEVVLVDVKDIKTVVPKTIF